MNKTDTDTIVALATPPGRGGVGIVRISGGLAASMMQAICGKILTPRFAEYLSFTDDKGDILDWGIALYFRAPNSFTGEDVLELHGHGGPVVMDLLIQRALRLGARVARPGEFSERAFLNDKLDLAQAEAIADLIEAGSSQAARAAVRSLTGVFSRQVHAITEALIELRSYIEATMDFPEEDVDFLADARIQDNLAELLRRFDSLKSGAKQGSLLREGMTLVIAGRPNAGKSSLLNALAGREAAIVTDIPGTTRDLLREHIQLDGLPLHIIDTAGLRETRDKVEAMGVDRAWQAIQSADRVLLVIDSRQGFASEDAAIVAGLPAGIPVTRVLNKCDLSHTRPGRVDNVSHTYALSAKTGAGLDAFKQHLLQEMGYQGQMEGEFLARRRHLQALDRAEQHIRQAVHELEAGKAGELAAEELRLAQQHLNEITGAFTSEDLLGRIFSSFCIGK
jgi:tRNA modification GTPase